MTYRRLLNLGLTVLADTAADLAGLLDEIRSESGTAPLRASSDRPVHRGTQNGHAPNRGRLFGRSATGVTKRATSNG